MSHASVHKWIGRYLDTYPDEELREILKALLRFGNELDPGVAEMDRVTLMDRIWRLDRSLEPKRKKAGK